MEVIYSAWVLFKNQSGFQKTEKTHPLLFEDYRLARRFITWVTRLEADHSRPMC